MRMDRYENAENNNENKQTRTNKNQELYSDVYLNNVYVDINNLENMVKEPVEPVKEKIRIQSQSETPNYKYEDKNYDIRSIIDLAIENKKDDKLKRNLDILEVNNQEIDSLIESINENQKKDTPNENETLLEDLLPSNDNTKIIPPLEKPILNSELQKEDLIENTGFQDSQEFNSLQKDTSFVEEKTSKLKIILPIIIILVVVSLVVLVLIKKDII